MVFHGEEVIVGANIEQGSLLFCRGSAGDIHRNFDTRSFPGRIFYQDFCCYFFICDIRKDLNTRDVYNRSDFQEKFANNAIPVGLGVVRNAVGIDARIDFLGAVVNADGQGVFSW